MGLSMTLRGDWVAMNITPSSFRHVGRLASANPVKEAIAQKRLELVHEADEPPRTQELTHDVQEVRRDGCANDGMIDRVRAVERR